jgi:two-component system, LytTR family, response regulator
MPGLAGFDLLERLGQPQPLVVFTTTIAELEKKLDPRRWVRIHRSTLIHVDAVKELHSWFGGKMLARLKDGQTELPVARERVPDVKAKLGL